MEQEKRSAIIVSLARAGRTASEIIKATKLPRSTVFRVLKAFKEEGKTQRKTTSREVMPRGLQGSWLA
ncbi:Uncharacterized protein FKW44_003805 [Caligus rogercresseyi]|uniref:Uncharacterized protein n=1 Tax=Caligus rogercresseyi TaxID=217165 RepID=A0A7T8KM56_CALRO|nr:Uncharacterized protein FKW44_003805 [Caligus rogercresseyi]